MSENNKKDHLIYHDYKKSMDCLQYFTKVYVCQSRCEVIKLLFLGFVIF